MFPAAQSPFKASFVTSGMAGAVRLRRHCSQCLGAARWLSSAVPPTADFGFQEVSRESKESKVKEVFSRVAERLYCIVLLDSCLKVNDSY